MPVIEILTRLEGQNIGVQLAVDGEAKLIPQPALELYAGQLMLFLQHPSWNELNQLAKAAQPASGLVVPPSRRLRRHPG